MLKRYHHFVGGIFRVVDACVIGAAWLLAYWMRFHWSIVPVTKGFPEFGKYAALTPLVMILWAMIFSGMNVYLSRRMLRRTHEVHLLFKAHLVALLVFIAMTYLVSEYRYSRGVMVNFALIGLVFLIFFRLSLRNALRAFRRRGYNLRHVLMVGEGAAIEMLLARLDKFPELGLRAVGVVTHASSQAQEIQKKPVLGHFEELSALIHKHGIDKVVVSLPRHQYGDFDHILDLLKDEMVEVQIIPDVHEYITLGCEIEDFDGVPIVNLNDSPLQGWGAIAKRVTDFCLSGLALIVLSPLFLLVGILVRVTSPGPILFSQERMGLDGKTFRMLKFRSMCVDAEKESGAVWAQAGDARRTPIGAFLRATSLDELPQFWNVLRGDMSLVGPRPERPVFVQQFRREISHYMLRHKVKAGVTGWAQINGWRGNTSLDRRIEHDLYYIRNWSYFLDWKILFLTLWKGFINKNAY